MGYDIGRFESRKFAEQGVDFQIVHPRTGPVFDDDGKPVTIKLGGADSPRIKAAVRERQKRRRKLIEEALPGVELSFDPQEDMIDDLVTLTFGWSDNLELDGNPLQFSEDSAKTLYKRFPEIAEQMTRKASDRINFMLAWSKG